MKTIQNNPALQRKAGLQKAGPGTNRANPPPKGPRMTTFSNAIAAAGEDLLTALAIQVQPEEVSLDDVIRSLEVRGEPFPRSLTSADPLAILLARERDGDYAFGS